MIFGMLRSRKVRCLLGLQNPAGIIAGITTCFLGFGSSLFLCCEYSPCPGEQRALGAAAAAGISGAVHPDVLRGLMWVGAKWILGSNFEEKKLF